MSTAATVDEVPVRRRRLRLFSRRRLAHAHVCTGKTAYRRNFDPEKPRTGLLAANDPIDKTDPTGLAVYFVTRKFDDPGFGSRFSYSGLDSGHAYLLFTVPGDPGTEADPLKAGYGALTTFSWHPQSWDYADKANGRLSKIIGRVWERHPADTHPTNYNIYLVTAKATEQKALLNAIYTWINTAPVGYEKGNPQDDPNNRGKNEIGNPLWHRTQEGNGYYYSLFDQNCVFWATYMLACNDIALPKKLSNVIMTFDQRAGAAEAVIEGKRTAMKTMEETPERAAGILPQ